jgi:26S proteasome regulatory subunit N12
MAEQELRTVLDQLHAQMRRNNLGSAASLLSRAKLALLKLEALLPTANTPGVHLALARETLELGALISIRLQDPEQFTRYFQQLQPFYALPSERLPAQSGNASKLTGLYLLLLLSQGDYLSFHMMLESLELAAAQNQARQDGGNTLVDDEYIQYPVRLEQALMEGSYDRVWGETKRERVPGEEFAVFSEVSRPLQRSVLIRAGSHWYDSG